MLILTDEQMSDLSLDLRTAAGNPGRVDGPPTWSVTNPTVCELSQSADGMTAVISALGLGTTQVSVSVDADLGEGVRTLSRTLDVTVMAAEVVSVGIIASTPRPKV